MEDRLLRAAEILDSKSFEQFDKPYPEIALQMTKSLTRGGHYHTYKKQEVMENTWEVLRKQIKTYGVKANKLPYETEYFNFDIPNDDRGYLEDFKNALSGQGPDSGKSRSGIHNRMLKINDKYKEYFGITKQQWYDFFPSLTYKLNTEGMRNDFDFADVNEYEFVPVFGDSNTFGMALPVDDIWFNKLNLNMPIYNSSVCSANLIDVYLLLVSMYNTKKFNSAYVVIPHSERWTGVSDNGCIEGIANGDHYLLKQFEHIGKSLNTNTRQFYRWIALQCIINFCLVKGIKLHLWENNTFRTLSWCAENNIVVPNWLFMHKRMISGLKIANDFPDGYEQWPKFCARDMVHFGTDWHDAIAEYMLTKEAI